ncbi:hypothetical protein AB0O91_05795 [Kitasatospora sp. NPDC089797]|uniref:hypothetical protein n=1 Tax=Kitasatospora sp. NPDC089797 TaxID=3155298 RepID=UPI003428E95F
MRTYQLRITGAAGAAPETAAVRLIARLPASWGSTLLSSTPTSATLAFTVPGAPSAKEVSELVDTVLAAPELQGWARQGTVVHRHDGEG